MSNVTTMAVRITNLDALAQACAKLGLEFVRDQQTYRWHGTDSPNRYVTPPPGFTQEELGRCLHAIRIPGQSEAYEIGVVERRDGEEGYTLLWDAWRGGFGLQDMIGENASLLNYHYSIEQLKLDVEALGDSVVLEEYQPDGSCLVRVVTGA